MLEWLWSGQGSTRPLGLFRILLILLLWSRFAADVALWNAAGPAEMLLGLTFFVLTGMALVGWQTRRVMALLAAVMALMYFHFGLNLGHVPWTHHHVYLLFICTLLCALGPCGRSFSLDRWLSVRAGTAGPEQGALLANRLFQLQLAAVYFWTAVDKTNADFLSGARLDQILHFHYDGSFLAPVILWTPLVIGAAVAVVIVEYFLAIGILLRRWLPAVFFFGFALHLTFYYLLPVSTFSLTMMAMYLFLLPPERVHDFFDRLLAPPNRPANEPQ